MRRRRRSSALDLDRQKSLPLPRLLMREISEFSVKIALALIARHEPRTNRVPMWPVGRSTYHPWYHRYETFCKLSQFRLNHLSQHRDREQSDTNVKSNGLQTTSRCQPAFLRVELICAGPSRTAVRSKGQPVPKWS